MEKGRYGVQSCVYHTGFHRKRRNWDPDVPWETPSRSDLSETDFPSPEEVGRDGEWRYDYTGRERKVGKESDGCLVTAAVAAVADTKLPVHSRRLHVLLSTPSCPSSLQVPSPLPVTVGKRLPVNK